MSTYLDFADYEEIRMLLGLAATDTTSLPDSTIERRLFLGFVEIEVGALVTAAAIVMDVTDPAYVESIAETVRLGISLMTAARIAAFQRIAAQGDEISSESIGPASVSYRTPPDWASLAASLRSEAVRVLTGLGEPFVGTLAGAAWDPDSFVVVGGPTRAEERDGAASVADQLSKLEPWILRGS